MVKFVQYVQEELGADTFDVLRFFLKRGLVEIRKGKIRLK